MDELIIYLREFGGIGRSDEHLIRAHACEMKLSRFDIFLEQDEIPTRIGYLVDGVLGAIRNNHRGDEVFAWFIEKRSFAVGFDAFGRRVGSTVSIQAVVDSKVVFINEQAFSRLASEIVTWDEIVKKLAYRDLIEGVAKRMAISGSDARTRYLNFEIRYPGLVDRIPQSMISNYLGIAPATISRIRKEIRRA